MTKTETAGGVVVNRNGDIVLVAQRNNVWSLPKGHIDPGESEVDAAVREIYEETGLRDVELIKKLGTYKRYKISKDGGDDISEEKTIHIYLFMTDQMELEPIDPDNPEARWVKKEEVTKHLTHKKDIEFFESIINDI